MGYCCTWAGFQLSPSKWAGQLGLVAQTEEQGSCPCPWPAGAARRNLVSRRPEADGGGDEEIPHATTSWIWGSERSGSHRGRRSTAVAAGQRGMEVEVRVGGQVARRLVRELRGAVPVLREVRLGLGMACSSRALSSSGRTPSGHRLGSWTTPARW
jgi:hypothetical protein